MTHYTNEQTAIEKRALARKLQKVEREARRKAIRERDRLVGLQITPTASVEDDAPRREPGDDNWSGFGFDLHPHVTFVSSFVLIAFILLTLMFHDQADAFFDDAIAFITGTMGWFMILAVNLFIIAGLYFGLSKFGTIRIGGVDAKPEFSTLGWYAMLLSAGMGIGLMFWSVGEPMFHYQSPSPMFGALQPDSPEAAQAAMGVTYFHWGIHPWAIYAMVGLGLAFFAFNRGLPLTIRSVFYPLLGDKIYGFWGNLIDILSVLATMVGLATSLGLGVQQINAGLNHLFGLSVDTQTQVILIAVITGFATLSVFAGLDAGVKRLSQANMVLAALFMAFLLLVGPTVYILSGFTQNLGYYLTILPELSLWTETFRDSNWQGSWTVFYWAWWISWS
ncbi:MAG TPA: glycine/betaine ABC transporter, partial [Chromatiaceae bacterium]|nr:glycine/betaine ABC transporter [Chromatiaceae bacterium]